MLCKTKITSSQNLRLMVNAYINGIWQRFNLKSCCVIEISLNLHLPLNEVTLERSTNDYFYLKSQNSTLNFRINISLLKIEPNNAQLKPSQYYYTVVTKALIIFLFSVILMYISTLARCLWLGNVCVIYRFPLLFTGVTIRINLEPRIRKPVVQA